ncbi:LRP chaperone MESD-like [Dysidea avara]|uniref:LRP chaperone MESD-like n=1 Tax=Dysidea avara TaxID=196820 RepID=UPI0033227FE9
MKLVVVFTICVCLLFTVNADKKKDIRDYTEADLERLYQQWADEDDEEEDEFRRKPPRPPAEGFEFDPSKMSPQDMMKMAKKGKTLMIFAQLKGKPEMKETEKITTRWQQGLLNGNIQTERYVVSTDRALFLTKDGSLAWEIKDFLVQQPECLEVSFDNQKFPGLKSEL